MTATRLAGPAFGACIGLVTPAFGYSDVGFVIHMQQTSDVTDCDAPGGPEDPLLTCDAIVEVGNLGSPQKAWVIAYWWSNIPGFPDEEGLGSAGHRLLKPAI